MKFGGFGFDRLLALIDILVAAWRAIKPIGAFFKSYTARGALTNKLAAARLFAAKSVTTHKNCPHCAEQMPISALICDACDFNFLSGTVGTGLKSLPAPAAMTRQVPKPHLVFSRL